MERTQAALVHRVRRRLLLHENRRNAELARANGRVHQAVSVRGALPRKVGAEVEQLIDAVDVANLDGNVQKRAPVLVKRVARARLGQRSQLGRIAEADCLEQILHSAQRK